MMLAAIGIDYKISANPWKSQPPFPLPSCYSTQSGTAAPWSSLTSPTYSSPLQTEDPALCPYLGLASPGTENGSSPGGAGSCWSMQKPVGWWGWPFPGGSLHGSGQRLFTDSELRSSRLYRGFDQSGQVCVCTRTGHW